MTKVLIIEDEPAAARRLMGLVRGQIEGAEVDLAVTREEAEERLGASPYDVICLDLNLRGDDGFRVLKTLSASGSAVIVVSAHIDRAIEAFSHGVVDFVPKPVAADRFGVAIKRALAAKGSDRSETILVRHRSGVEIIRATEIVSITAAGDYVEILTNDGHCFIDDRPLNYFEDTFPEIFVRVHRSHVIGTAYLRRIEREDSLHVAILEDGTRLTIARRQLARLRGLLGSSPR